MNLLRRCFDCGQPLGKKDQFCPRCGAKQPREPKRAAMARVPGRSWAETVGLMLLGLYRITLI